jgi:D-alanyl-D-alanine carboxypeptidase/D-alanyl-D-alanine-endopeptidase (penicillin-binding protein 4)
VLRRVLVALVTIAVAFSASATAGARHEAAPIATRLARALAVPHVRAARSAAVAVELRDARAVFTRHQSLALVPASNQKLAVAYAALATLGPTYRIQTFVYGEGELVGATWKGNLVLKGFGDPTLSRGDLRALASQLRSAGVRRVAGAIEADESYFDSKRTGPAWKSHFYLSQSPALSALTVDRGSYQGWLTAAPALAAGKLFRVALRSAGISVTGRAKSGVADAAAEELAMTSSAPLSQIVRFMNRESDNFTAEILLKQLGAIDEAAGTSVAGAKVVGRVLAASGIPLAGVRIVDGSGLSPRNRLTAAALIALLVAAWHDPVIHPAFVRSLAVAGVNGTLSHRMERPPARGAVLAKTGTTRESSALSGYVRGRFAFAVLQNGGPVSQFWARRAQDRFAGVLAAQ